ncbi:hypothetical protein V7S79_05125 [Aquirufa sp. ROCK-SH2]
MRIFIPLLALVIFASCEPKDSPKHYFSDAERDSLLVNIITNVAENATYANDSTRFNPEFRAYYVNLLPKYTLEKLEKTGEGQYVFLLNRPVGHLTQYRRSVIGKFNLKEGSLLPLNFEEVANTPHLEPETALKRGKFLFKELALNGNLKEYIPLKHYVEWPDSTLTYNKKWKRWLYHE